MKAIVRPDWWDGVAAKVLPGIFTLPLVIDGMPPQTDADGQLSFRDGPDVEVAAGFARGILAPVRPDELQVALDLGDLLGGHTKGR